MSLPRKLQIWSQHWNFHVDIYFPEFNHPSQYTNNKLVVRGQLRVKYGCHVFGRFIPKSVWVHRHICYLLMLPELVLHVCFNILYRFLHILRWDQPPYHVAIFKFHQLHPCTQVDIRVSQWTRFQTNVFIQPFEDFRRVIPNGNNIINVKEYILVLFESVALSRRLSHPHIRVSKARLVSHLFHTVRHMILERCTIN